MTKTFILLTDGTHGDVMPFLRLGRELRERGHEVAVLTHGTYESAARAAGFDFAAIDTEEEHRRRLAAEPELLLNMKSYLPSLPGHFERQGLYAQMRRSVELIEERYRPGRTVLVARFTSFAALMAAERCGVPLATIALVPHLLLSLPVATHVYSSVVGAGITQLRAGLGLEPVRDWDAYWRSAGIALGTWPAWFDAAGTATDVVTCGFLLDHESAGSPESGLGHLPAAVRELLAGPVRPVLITGGTGKILDEQWYRLAAEAAARAGVPALLVTRYRDLVPDPLPAGVLAVEALPFADVMPHVSAIVHHGGMGTCARALQAGVPQLILTQSLDRPDNAARLARVGVAQARPAKHTGPEELAGLLRAMVSDPAYAERIGGLSRSVDPAVSAATIADHVETLFGTDRATGPLPVQHPEPAAAPAPVDSLDSTLADQVAGLDPRRRAALARLLAEKRAQRPDTEAAPATIPVQPRTGDRSEFPCSPAQQRMWIAVELARSAAQRPAREQWDPSQNSVVSLRLTGPLDVPAMVAAFDDLVARHETLRTVFVEADGEPRQVVGRPWSGGLAHMDLREPGHRLDAWARALSAAEQSAAEPFDLSAGPLVRATLYRAGDDEHLFLLTVAHIVVDGWSMGVLCRELAAAYNARRRGSVPVLPALRLQYADLTVWQREQLTRPAFEERVRYFTDRLEPLPAPAILPTVGEREVGHRPVGAKFGFEVPAGLLSRLVGLGGPGTTPFAALVAGLKVLLARYAGTGDVTVGTLFGGRGPAEAEAVVGNFVNILVLRSAIDLDNGFRAALGEVRGTVAGAFARQDVPFDVLLQRLAPERDPDRLPLCNVGFVVHNVPGDDAVFDGLRADPGEVAFDDIAFDLAFVGYPASDGGMRMVVEYPTDLFDVAAIERLAGHFGHVLEQVAGDPDRPLTALELLDAAESAQVQPAAAPLGGPVVPVPALINARIAVDPEAIAVVDGSGVLTYADLGTRAHRLAAGLVGRGITRGSRVGICAERSGDLVVAVLAAWFAGAAYVPVSHTAPTARIARQLADAEVATVLVDSAGLAALPGDGAVRVPIVRIDEPLTGPEPAAGVAPVTGDDLAYVVYTSGSTGEPKGVAVNHAGLGALARAWRQEYDLSADDRHLQMAGAAFDVFTGDLVRALSTGGALVLCPSDHLLDPARLHALIMAERVSVAEFVPVVVRALIDHLRAEGSALGVRRLVIVGSDVWPAADHRALRELVAPGVRVLNSYGVTEATIDSAYYEGAFDGHGPVPIGRALPGAFAHVLDSAGRPCPLGIPGELHLGGLGLATGYLGRPDATAAAYLDTPHGRLYRTGDRAVRHADGTLRLFGRLDDQVKIRGQRVEPGEVAAVLRLHPGVGDAVVLDDPGPDGQGRLVAFVTGPAHEPGAGTSAVSATQLRAFVRDHVPLALVPAAFVTVPTIPLTASGKPDRRALPSPDVLDAGAQYIAPATAAQQCVADIFADLLARPRIGVGDDFFDLGGHSLLAARAASRLRLAFEVDLPLRTIFEHSTVAALADAVEELIIAEIEALSEEEAALLLDAPAPAAVPAAASGPTSSTSSTPKAGGQ